ncbi:PD-(D/E)XK nuclease domain-containing protein [Treponema sp. TIM-1]|uniref:ATP-binding protein n=1 Tax=Treponema sp. TIM-1 TaxID=2898417 RepID=UPI00397FE6A8
MKRPVRFFNTTGPCNPEDHYMLPPADRLVGAQLHRYIRDKLYWVLHAPRQTGKTTFLQSWMREINSGDEAIAGYVSVERCQGVAEAERAMPDICKAVQEYASAFGLPVPELGTAAANSMLSDILMDWSRLAAPKSLVVLFDEVDVLEGETLISFLRQLRGGFARRGPGLFPASIALVGMRDLKDYITAAKGGVAPNPGSPFNIKEDSATLTNFSRADLTALFAQRTAETGQEISAEALDYVYEQSQGQPWIVNSLFKRATMRVLDETSRETVRIGHIQEAREQMILARETHLDALGQRLRDPKIKWVIESIFVGTNNPSMGRTNPDVELAMDLGLITWSSNKGFIIANPVYEEILTRYLNSGYHDNMPPPSSWRWQKEDGSLDMDSLLGEFQLFWQTNSEIWEQTAEYTEAFPHLLLMAFLQWITNGEGRIEREYAAGRGRMDLAVEYHKEWNIIEIKLLRKGQTFEMVKAQGIKQVLHYRDTFSGGQGSVQAQVKGCYLVIFDRRPEAKGKTWEERITWTVEDTVRVVGC